MRKLFGTDGIRGVAGEYPLDQRTTYVIGRALGHHLLKTGNHARVIIGQDTRESSEPIANSLARGLLSHHMEVHSAGVMTTPGIAYLARTGGFAAGVVVSASHNPWRDNGIKVFGADGYKLPDEVELAIEQEIFSHLTKPQSALELAPALSFGSTLPGETKFQRDYIDWLASNVASTDFSQMKVLVDCANGAATPIAHEVFRAVGAEASFIFDKPDGRNVNHECGAMHPEVIAAAVRRGNSESRVRRYALGITFDGDADRALFSDERGNIINGDAILLLCARLMQQRGMLAGNLVVATTMSNMGLEIALRESGIRMLRAPVGDKYVLDEMRKSGATLGGEQSGHIIFRDGDATTGDGPLTALRVMAKMARTGKSIAELVGDLTVFPQMIRNIRVREKKPLQEIPDIAAAIRKAESELQGSGRVVVRYSGTEALARVMVEADSEERMQRIANAIAHEIQKALGA
ncbi:MAG: phosphoglucosamine mutase [Terriglobales bacterium]